jgi:hypothetical protein
VDVTVAPDSGLLRLSGQTPLIVSGTPDTAALVDFTTPLTAPKIGADQQRFRVLVRKTSTSNPTVDISLYENGVLVALLTTETVLSDVGQTVVAYWDASLLVDPTGAGVQCYVYGHTVDDSQIEIGAVVWESRRTAVSAYRETPAGRGRRRRRRYIVEVDGREFATDSAAEAVALLERAAELARVAAEKAAEAQVERQLPRARITGRANPVTLTPPTVAGPPELAPELERARARIDAAYAQAALEAELALLLKLQQERDDEETLLLLAI